MRVIGVISLKGGVGKTSVVLGLAGAVAARGGRALVIDLDPQANATTVLDPSEPTFTANDVLADGRSGTLRAAVTPSGWGPAVDVVAAEPSLEHRNRSSSSDELRLRVAMAGLDGYDLVLLDCPPSLGSLTKNALAASDRALVVTEPSLFALQGAQQAVEAVEVVRSAFNLGLRTAGIVVNRVRSTPEHRFRVAELVDAYGPLVLTPPIPDRNAVGQAEGAYVPVQRWRSTGAREVAAVLDGYLDRLLAKDDDPRALRRQRRRDKQEDQEAESR